MSTVAEVVEKDLDGFLSPIRVLARSFQRSRAKWKQKYQDLKVELHRWKVRVHDVNESRDRWKEQAEVRQRELVALQAQLTELQRQLGEAQTDHAQKKGPPMTAGWAS